MSETNKPINQGLDEIREEVSRIINSETQIFNSEQMPTCRQNDLKFPESVMTGVAGDFANLYSSYLESPKEFFFMAFLTCEGTLLANQLTLDSEITPQPRLYTVLLGESADDRKSTAIKKTVDFFREFYEERFTVCSGVGSAEGLQQILKKTEDAGLLLCFDEFNSTPTDK